MRRLRPPPPLARRVAQQAACKRKERKGKDAVDDGSRFVTAMRHRVYAAFSFSNELISRIRQLVRSALFAARGSRCVVLRRPPLCEARNTSRATRWSGLRLASHSALIFLRQTRVSCVAETKYDSLALARAHGLALAH